MENEDRQFFQDLRAAVMAGAPLETGSKWAPARTLRKSDINAFEASSNSKRSTPDRFDAALETYRHTGSMLPVLEGLSTRVRSWQRVKRMYWRSMWYVMSVALLAAAGLLVFHRYVAPQMQMIRNDLVTLAGTDRPLESWNTLSFVPAVSFLFAVVLVLLVVWMLLGGVVKTGWWIGGREYIRCCTMGSAIRAMRMLIASGMPKQQAAEMGVRLAAVDKVGHGEILALINRLSEAEIQSSHWSDYLAVVAEQRYLSARAYGPILFVAVVAGLIALVYSLLIYGPLVSLLFDLSVRTRV